MRALVIYCNPNPSSFSAHLRDRVVETLHVRGAEVRLNDLYGCGFDPVMSRHDRAVYHTKGDNEVGIADHLDGLRWCDTLIFVYPTWWFGLPAMLKGWLDKVFVPHATFTLPTKQHPMRPHLQHISKLAAVTTCGASFIQSKWVGEPGRRTILRGTSSVPSAMQNALCCPLQDRQLHRSHAPALCGSRGPAHCQALTACGQGGAILCLVLRDLLCHVPFMGRCDKGS